MATSPTTTTYPDNASSQTAKSLAGDIVGATRSMHTKINKLVTSRLPLALPPRASDAGPYISGLLYFLPVYMTFEKAWLDIIDTPPVGNVVECAVSGAENGKGERLDVSERVHAMLKSIYVPQLFRSDRLKADIKSMTGWSDDILDRQIHIIRGTGQLSAFLSHIKQTVSAKPHVLIAYSYNLFMALFAGGRFIRASFENVSPEFWETVPAPIKPTLQPCESSSVAKSPEQVAEVDLHSHAQQSMPLAFWRFDSPNDGEGLKQEFKEKLLRWGGELTAEERDDVIQESVIILESIGLLVGQLDTVCNDEQDEKPDIQIPMRPSLASLFGKTQFGTRLRDSLLIARERGVGNPFRNQSFDTVEAEKREHESGNQGHGHGHAATGAEVCPGIPKSMRFAKSLPIPPRKHGRRIAAANNRGSDSKSRPSSQRHHANATMIRRALAGVVGLFLLYVLFTRIKEVMS
ncbi:hypothetical protein V8C37DRAFT_170163 [Trichoderma ceciliae]